jgi:ribose transport system ATP-binding protein
MEKEKIIEIKNLTKIFDGKDLALDDVSFDIYKGEVHGLVGKNGAGKSTLIKILTGQTLSTKGTITYDGKIVRFRSVAESLMAGIKVVNQDYQVCENLNVWQNIFLYEREKSLKFVNRRAKVRACNDFLKKFNLNLKPTDVVTNLNSAGKQLVCIAKALATKEGEKIRVLVLDEPTATLSLREKEVLFETIESLKKQGITIIFVSHILKDVIDISDRISIIRDSKYIGTLEGDVTEDQVIEGMIGQKRTQYDSTKKVSENGNKEILKADNLTTDRIRIENFTVRENEIVGLAGLEGCGASELMRAISGVKRKKAGNLFIQGKKVKVENVLDAVRNKIIYISGEKSECLMNNFSILNNLITLNVKKFTRGSFLRSRMIRNYAEKQVKDFSIKIGSLFDSINSLSGGNQRKVIVSKFISVGPKILMMDDNTKGIDINAKYELFEFLKRFRKKGTGVIFYSTEIEEVLMICDVVHVMKNGKIIATIDLRKESIDVHELTYMITSGPKDKEYETVTINGNK